MHPKATQEIDEKGKAEKQKQQVDNSQHKQNVTLNGIRNVESELPGKL